MLVRLLSVLACTAAVASAQLTLSTTFANNNGGAVGGAVYFDLNAAGVITVTDIDLNFGDTAGTAGSIDIYTIVGGTYAGNESTAAPWGAAVSSAPGVVTNGPGVPTNCMLSPPLVLTGNTAVTIVANGLAHAYTNGAAPQTTYSGVNLDLVTGSASNVPWTGPLFMPRIVNCNVNYSPGMGTPGTNTSIGAGCYEEYASFYEDFAAGTNDLANSAITLTNVGSGFAVTAAGSLNPLGSLSAPTALALTDDSSVAAGTLGLTVHSNGFVSFGGGNSNVFTPTVAMFLNDPDAAVRAWHDYNPAAAGSGLVQYEEAGTQAQVTWDGVFDFGGTTPNTLQFQIDTASGDIVIAYGALSGGGNGHLVGYSPGGANADPGTIDLSTALPIVTSAVDVLPLTLAASTRPVIGTTWDLAVGNGAAFDLVIFANSDPMIADLAAMGAPGCGLRADVDYILVGTTVSLPIPNIGSLVGRPLFANGASLAPGANAFGAITSNGIRGGVGDI